MQTDASGRGAVDIKREIVFCEGVALTKIGEPAVDVGTPGADSWRRHEIIAFPDFRGEGFIIVVRTILFRGERRGID